MIIFSAILTGFIIAFVAYHCGYMNGYSVGMDYGREKLKEYHEYTMKGLNGLNPHSKSGE
jgi:hypothetical protein